MDFSISTEQQTTSNLCISGASMRFLSELYVALDDRLDGSTAIPQEVRRQLEELKKEVYEMIGITLGLI